MWRAFAIGYAAFAMAGALERGEIDEKVTAWIAHAEQANSWRVRRSIFGGGWYDPRGNTVGRS